MFTANNFSSTHLIHKTEANPSQDCPVRPRIEAHYYPVGGPIVTPRKTPQLV